MRLELQQISKTFGPLKANQDITYTFESGKIYAILGENGAGKSTLMKIIAGYQAPDPGGRILIDGQPVTIHAPSDAIRHRIGMLYQDPLDFAPMTALENFITARPGVGWLPNWGAARAEFARLAARLGFALDPDRLIETMTMGERQQLEIVRLLALEVRFLILDEPTTGISETQRTALFAALRQLAHADGLSIVIVTHKLQDVEALCDAVMVLRHGRMVGAPLMPVSTAELVRLMLWQTQPARSPPPRTAGRGRAARGGPAPANAFAGPG
ncbi:MAG: ATP-binding cassette domain-containing protein, partial [Anaerolineae bacterium]|nr:ATP-binding cassette domain-containing protein [Anaerolineae bacterium]